MLIRNKSFDIDFIKMMQKLSKTTKNYENILIIMYCFDFWAVS